MIRKNKQYKLYITALFLCFLQVAGIDVYAQEPAHTAPQDSLRTAPKARARRNRPVAETPPDTLKTIISNIQKDSLLPAAIIPVDSLTLPPVSTALADSLAKVNKENMEKLTTSTTPKPIPTDSLPPVVPAKRFLPNPNRATWLAVVFPGGGQIYNRKYWKLPIIYGGFVGCAYALTWNNKMYKDYSNAYIDIMDDNPNTNRFMDFIRNPDYDVKGQEQYLKDRFKRGKDTYRRYRDMSIFAFIGVYLISIIDAYVDAELSDFDISPDLSMRVEPTMINTQFRSNGSKAVGVQCSFRF